MNPITRKEMFLAAAGGQNVETPTPVTREEVFLNEIAKGGGSSGGGVLVVNATFNGTGAVCDKTAAEMWEAAKTGLVIIKAGPATYTVIRAQLGDGYYTFVTYNKREMYFDAESGTGYPTFIPE